MPLEVEEKDQTEFNAAIATLMRIDAIKKQLIFDVLTDNHTGRYRDITAFYLELVSVLKEEEEKTQLPKFKQHRKNQRELNDYVGREKGRIPAKLIDWLDDWEMELKNLEQKYGLNMPKKFDPRFAMAGRARR